jgi:tRNA (cytidine/uridine-2'-O-)-methyltransferase
MFEIVLHEPEIPPNTGNIMRLCANTGARLHLIEPLGFVLSDRRMRRAGLDYEDKARTCIHAVLGDCERMLAGRRWFAVSTRGERLYTDCEYRPGDVFLFGAETRGLPAHVLMAFEPQRLIRLPMAATSRSLNLANAVAVVVYEAWRQCGFTGASLSPRETEGKVSD